MFATDEIAADLYWSLLCIEIYTSYLVLSIWLTVTSEMASRSNKRLYLAALIACLTASLFGYSVGFIGGVLVLPSFLHHFHLDNLPPLGLAVAQSRIVSSWLLGALLGVPFGMPVCSRWGRRRCLNFSAALYVLGSALQLVNVNGNVLIFEAGRLLNGLGVGAGTLVSPM
jgi:MFS family permease